MACKNGSVPPPCQAVFWDINGLRNGDEIEIHLGGTVNRYRVAQAGKSAIVYYWYQGRGRVAHDEFKVKYELLRDAAIHGRTEEALVRIVVPVTTGSVTEADLLARRIAPALMAEVDRVLPPL